MIITAPLPPVETPELPITLNAYTFANILEPQGKLYGLAVRAVTGIVH
jgi:hypothetical protein